MKDMEAQAVDYVAAILDMSMDWQEGQHALASHDGFHAWIVAQCDGDEMAQIDMCQRIIRKAEEKNNG